MIRLWLCLRSCGMAAAVAGSLVLSAPVSAQEHGGSAGAPPPVDTSTNPDAVILNQRNPLAIHAGPGKPNVGSIYMPPTLSGKDKGKNAKAGQTESNVMGAQPTH
jgi:hypothetical protein